MVEKNYLILGAGVSGLTVANELVKQGCKVVIYEKSESLGGLASTYNFKGFPIDSGPHIFHSAHKEIVNYWKDLVGNSLVEKVFILAISKMEKSMIIQLIKTLWILNIVKKKLK